MLLTGADVVEPKPAAGEHGDRRPGQESEPVEIFTDGACKGNPGPGGWGTILRSGRHEKELYGGDPATTNNRMEIMAAIQGLESLTRGSSVRLYTDSEYLRKGISEWVAGWKRNGWKTKDKKSVKNVDLWTRLDDAAHRHQIEWLWVKGHAGHPENERADVLACRGADEAAARAEVVGPHVIPVFE